MVPLLDALNMLAIVRHHETLALLHQCHITWTWMPLPTMPKWILFQNLSNGTESTWKNDGNFMVFEFHFIPGVFMVRENTKCFLNEGHENTVLVTFIQKTLIHIIAFTPRISIKRN
jgi:hypothetical protein